MRGKPGPFGNEDHCLVSHLVPPPTSGPSTKLQRNFPHEVGIIPALYLTGTKCRDPLIRCKAQALLASSQRKEGMWESLLAAKTVERCIAIEEDGNYRHQLWRRFGASSYT